METNNNKDYLLPSSIIVAAILIAGSIIYLVGTSKNNSGTANNGGQNPTATNDSVQKQGPRDVILGDAKAPVTIIEYGDYQCPFCVRFSQTTEQSIKDSYVKDGKVKLVFRNFQFLGAESELAGQAAECSKDQNNFWAYHDTIYQAEGKDGKENNGNMNKAFFVELAKNVGLDVDKFTSCYDSGKYADTVKQSTQNAAALGVNSTPTTFVNGQIVKGALPFDQFKTIIDAALNK
ncbi:MAG: DsbA family protein [Candidatus Liptonbacteria bacterium]|nr:DsbA family protein [Candidatus Liptonbacteria bacterium]